MCGKSEENTAHLFLNCKLACVIWQWLGRVLLCSLDLSNFAALFLICSSNYSTKVKDVITPVVINFVWLIWYSKNKIRFEDRVISTHSVIIMIVAYVSLSGIHSTGIMIASMTEFSILKSFLSQGMLIKLQKLKKVNWYPIPWLD